MSKLIDADKLKSEIEIIQQSLENRDVYGNQVKKIRTECMIEFCKCIFDAITALQQERPEVDLEKEIKQYAIGFIGELRNYTDWTPRIARFARYFYELGLNTRKGN